MRNPNGYGSVVKLSGNRRRPFMVRVTTGYKENGLPVYAPLGYFPKREDALIFLAQFNDNPYDTDYRKITMSELFKKLQEIKYPKFSVSLRSALDAAFGHCKRLHSAQYRSLKTYQMQACIDTCGKSYATQSSIKNLFYHLDRLAFEMDIISKRYSDTLTVAPPTPKEKSTFTDAEVAALWKLQGDPAADAILFMLYTGTRISEMLGMRCADIDLDGGCMRGGVKTESGKNRVIPIHSKIKEIVARHYGQGEVLFSEFARENERRTVAAFRKRWVEIMESLSFKHLPHDCRHTFRSKLDSAGANKVCIDLIMGHKSSDIGERVYTHKTISELKEAVEKLSYVV